MIFDVIWNRVVNRFLRGLPECLSSLEHVALGIILPALADAVNDIGQSSEIRGLLREDVGATSHATAERGLDSIQQLIGLPSFLEIKKVFMDVGSVTESVLPCF